MFYNLENDKLKKK